MARWTADTLRIISRRKWCEKPTLGAVTRQKRSTLEVPGLPASVDPVEVEKWCRSWRDEISRVAGTLLTWACEAKVVSRLFVLALALALTYDFDGNCRTKCFLGRLQGRVSALRLLFSTTEVASGDKLDEDGLS